MVTRVEALINHEILVWARDSAGIDIETAAKKLPVNEDRLRSWESGATRPTVKQLRKLAGAYKRPLAVFYLPEPPQDFQPMHDFRRLPGEVAGVQSMELRYEIRRAIARRSIALELYKNLGERIPQFRTTGSMDDAPEELAKQLRGVLKVQLSDQLSWQPGYDSFNRWREALENAGILVLQMISVAPEESRGFSISETPLPVVVLNTKDSPAARCFTLLHELAHITLRKGGLCDLDDHTARPPEELATEVYCNMVAGSTLVPSNALLQEPMVLAQRRFDDWKDSDIVYLANRYGVSREVILRRLLVLGKTTDAFYRQQRRLYIRQAQQREKEREAGFAPPDRMAVASAGPTFTRLVLENYQNESITASDVADFLEVRLKHLSKIQEAILG